MYKTNASVSTAAPRQAQSAVALATLNGALCGAPLAAQPRLLRAHPELAGREAGTAA